MNSEDDTLAGGLPHSEIPGSPIARISPGLFAACHVLHRLSVPRHPPDALLMLPYATPNGKHHRPNALRLVEATGDTLKVSPIAPAPCAQGTPLRTVSRTMPRRKPGPIQVRHSSPFRRHFVTEPTGQENPGRGFRRGHNSLLYNCPSATPARSKTGREFGHPAAMSERCPPAFGVCGA